MATELPPGAMSVPPLFAPRLDARHNAMLRQMGVAVWWDGVSGPEQAVPKPVTAVPKPPLSAPPPVPVVPPLPDVPRRSRPVPLAAAVPPSPAHNASLPEPDTDWVGLQAQIRACQACPLSGQRRQAVPGAGDEQRPDWLIVGEAPGEEEDRQGLPFVGRAGQLLDRMLHAMGLQRDRGVYIANVIKCRPPQNRNPEAAEIAQCQPYLWRQIELLRPRIVLALGRFAAQTLLAQGGGWTPEALQQTPLGKLRGRVHSLELAGQSLPLVVSYHPAYLLRSPAEKAKSWADLCLALDTLAALPPRLA